MNNSVPGSFSDAMNRAAAGAPGRPFLLKGNECITYGAVLDRIARLSALYRLKGLLPGDRVIVATGDDGAAVTLFLSLLLNGLTAVMLDPLLPAAAAAPLVSRSDARAIMIDDELAGRWDCPSADFVVRIRKEAGKAGSLFSKLMGRSREESSAGGNFYPGMLKDIPPALPAARVDPGIAAYIIFTSGTTSGPKGVEMSHAALCHHLDTLSREFGYNVSTRILDVLPLHHADGLVQGPLVAFWNGAAVSRPMTFAINRIPQFLDRIYAERITHLVATPAMLSLIYRYGAGCDDCFRTEDFRFVISAASKLEAHLWSSFEARFGTMVVNLYGLTETVTGGLFAGPRRDTRRIGTIGKPVDCEAMIADDMGARVRDGEEGELLLRGGNIMDGYFRDPDATAEVLLDGWLRTGDLVRVDADGFYHVLGRKKNVIISGGINVCPEEVTAVLTGHPAVVEAVTFGMADETWGEKVISCVVLEKGSGIGTEELAVYCRTYLPPEKMPDRIKRVVQLPKGPSGKVIMNEARKLLTTDDHDAPVRPGDDPEAALLGIAARCFNVPAISLSLASTAASTPGWDSLAHMELIVAVEKFFSVRLEPVDIIRIESLGDALESIREKSAARP